MLPVYIAASSHWSARGFGHDAVRAISSGKTDCITRRVNGEPFPYFRLPLEGDWSQRAQAAVTRCHASLGTLPAREQIPVFFASSSFQLGDLEARYSAACADTLIPFGEPDMGIFVAEIMRWIGNHTLPWCFSTACTSAVTALNAATNLLRHGAIQHALVLATEFENTLSLNGFHGLGLLSQTRPQPFSRQGDGLVLGEAVAALWLTTDRRQCPELCWRLEACELGLDAFSATGVNPDGSAIQSVIERTVGNATVDLVKVHATGATQTDLAEANALRGFFGENLPTLVSLKTFIGHTQGASGLVELAMLLACLDANVVPVIAGDDLVDICALRRITVPPASTVLMNSIGFGGSLGSMMLTREPL